MDVSIVIVNWNTCDYLAQCLQSLSVTASAADVSGQVLRFDQYTADVWVVDNASRDGSPLMVKQRFPWVKLIENDRNVGFAPANNQAIRASDSCYVLLLNSDTEVRPAAITTLIAALEANPEAGAAGAHLLNADGTLQPSCQPMLTPWREFWRLTFLNTIIRRATYNQTPWTAPEPYPVEVIKGACLIVRRSALDRIGLFDEQYFMYTEEVDLCYRLLHDGWKLYWLARADVVHYGEASSKQVAASMYVQLYRSKVQFYRKFGGENRARLFKRLVALAYYPRWLIAVSIRLIKPEARTQAQIFRHLLAALPSM